MSNADRVRLAIGRLYPYDLTHTHRALRMEPGDITIGRLLVHIGEPGGAVLRDAGPSHAARFRAQPAPVLVRPSLIRGLIGRQAELTAAVSALDAGVPVEISGPPGIGKSALLRHLAHHPRASLIDGTLYLSARHQSSADLRQAIFDAFYTSDTPARPLDADIRRGLQDKHALILLDDVALTQHELEEVFDVAPRCAFIVGARERSLWGEGRTIAVTGLPVDDATAFLERELERTLEPEERSAAAALAATLDGHPLRIRQAVSLLRSRGLAPDRWTDHLSPDTLIAEALTSIDDRERRVLLALAAMSGVPIQLPHVSGIADLTEVGPTLTALARRGLVSRHQLRHRLVEGVADRLRRTEDLKPPVNRAITYFTAWADRQRRNHDSLLEAADALVRVQEYAIEERRWGEALRLGRQLERPLVNAGRWGAWETVLERCLTAAKALSDRSVEAWALHQLGTRSVCLADADRARRALDQAASLRDDLGESAAAAVSRRNLSFIVTRVSDEERRTRSALPFEDVGGDDPLPPGGTPSVPARSRMNEIGALAVTFLLCAALGGFSYSVIAGREPTIAARDPEPAPAPAASSVSPAPAAPPAESVATAPVTDTAAARRASILIFTARPGSIATKRPTDLCYAVSDAVRTRIEPAPGDVDTADTLTCRRVMPARTTTYELVAVGRDGIPVSRQLVIVVR